MDANLESQANGSMFSPDISGEAADESMPQEDNANPNTSSSQDDIASRLSALEQENANLRKGVNPLLDENKELKAQLESFNRSGEVQQEESDDDLSAEYERLDIATNTRLKAEIASVKAELKREEEIKSLNLGEHARTLESLLRLPENAGKSAHMVAEEHRLGDLAKIAEARSKGIIGNSPNQNTKDYSNPDNINTDDRNEYRSWIHANSVGGGSSIKFNVEGN